ncbi:hypothetical protein KY285_000561 [Solanum tuberosum]|nr:hypothetical protein KY285_000561 [Solanum tuberosum]
MQHSISTAMAGDSTSTASGTSSTTHNSFVTVFPSPNLAHQISVNITSSILLLWKTQFLPMIRGCGLDYHIEGDEVIPERLRDDNEPNPTYNSWVREDQLVLSWIIASVSEGPTYRPFTRSLQSRQEEIYFDALYGMLLNEER